MKKIVRILSIIYIIVSCAVPVFADYTQQSTTQLVWGIDRIDVTNYTSKGTQKATVLKIDLTNPRLKIKLLSSEKGVSYLSNVRTLANQEERVVASVNADFFAWYYKDNSRGSAVGLNVSEGELISSPPTDEELASLVFTTSGDVLTQYFKPNMSLTTKEGRTEKIRVINKYDSLKEIAMYTPSWGKTFSNEGGGAYVAVVEEDTIREIINTQGEIEIPENGYILTGLSDFTDFFTEGIKVGDKITTALSFSPYFGDIETAVGGGTVLIKNGQTAPCTHMRYGSDFRTAAGVSEDGKTLYLITVDKGSGSIGMTLDQLRNLMFSFDIYDGINFDGGGSTQMVARGYTDREVKYINSPENGFHRPVVNALAVMVTGGERGEPDGITVVTDKDAMIVGETVTASFGMYDQLYYPMEAVGGNKAIYTFSGVKGTKEGNTFTPAETGTLNIVAEYGKYSAYKSITVTDPDKYVDADSVIYKVKSGQTVPVVINAVTKSGKQKTISLSQVGVTVSSDIAEFNGENLVAKKSGFGKITFIYGEFTFSAYLSVDGVMPEDKLSQKGTYKDDFEKENGSALSYPQEVSSNYNITGEEAFTGKKSGKLWFDFDNGLTVLQSAYAVLDNPPVIINEGKKISVAIKGKFENLSLKAMLYDGKGAVQRLTLAPNLTEEGWQTYTADVPSDIILPAKLVRLYVVETKGESRDRGAVYFDNLTISSQDIGYYNSDPKANSSFVPQIVINGGIDEGNSLLGPIARNMVNSSFSSIPLSYSFDCKVKGKILHENGKKDSIGNIALVQFAKGEDITPVNFVGSVVYVTADLKIAQKEKTAEKLQGQDAFVVYKGESLSVQNIKGVRFISLPSITPSIVTNQKTFVNLELGIKNGETAYRLKYLPLWD